MFHCMHNVEKKNKKTDVDTDMYGEYKDRH